MQAETIALALLGEGSRFASVAVLQARMDALQVALPGISVIDLMRRDLRVLTADPDAVVRRMILFSKQLNRPNLHRLVSVAPQLLYAEVCHRTVQHPFVDVCKRVQRVL